MAKNSYRIFYFIFIGVLLSFIIPKPLCSQDKSHLSEKYQRWLEKEVVYIITDTELELFLSLKDEHAREEFIKDFWLARDPTPGTIKNEYKDEHYVRIAQANKLFRSAGRDLGWKTDRGRIYILLGPPEERKMWDDPLFTEPLELWSYRGNPAIGLPPYFYLLFCQYHGVGEYKLFVPGFDPVQRLLRSHDPMMFTDYVRIYEQLAVMSPELSIAARSYLPEEPTRRTGPDFSPESFLLLRKISVTPYRLADLRYVDKYLTGTVYTEYAFLTMAYQPTYLLWLDASRNYFLDFSFLVQPQDITVQSYQGEYFTSFEIEASLQDVEGGTLAVYKDRGDHYFTKEEIEAIKGRPMAYLGRIPLTAGSFELQSRLTNTTSKRMGRSRYSLMASNFDSEPVLIGMLPLLSYRLLGEKGLRSAPFTTDQYELIPSLNGAFRSGGSGYIFFQMGFPEKWKIEEGERVRLRYEIYRDGEHLSSWKKEELEAEQLIGAVVSVIEPLPIAELGRGKFNLWVFLLNERKEALLIGSLDFAISPEELFFPWKITKPFPAIDSIENRKVRASIYFRQEEFDKAATELERILKAVKEDENSVFMLASVRMKQGNYEGAIALLEPLLVKRPNDVNLLKPAGECLLQMKNYSGAVKLLERARMQQPEDTEILNKLGSAYYGVNKKKQAQELWSKSLKLNPNQPGLRHLIETIQKNTNKKGGETRKNSN